jgi:hypothetical protein
VQEALQTTTGEKEQLHKLFTDIKHQLSTTQHQCSDYQKRLLEEITNRKSIED